MVGDPILSVRGVDKSFGGLRVLRDVGLDVHSGSITGLVGPNGSGKSTLFDVITRYLPCDAGEVSLAGESLLGLAPYEVSRRGLARTFQLTRVFANLTVAENVLVFAEGGQDGEGKAHAMLEFVGLLRLAGQEAARLSYGQQKLLEIAQVLMLDPRVLLLDEPMAGINPALADELVQRLCELRGRGLALLLVEHNIPVIQRMCDTVAVLAAGSVMACGKPDEVLADRGVREAFLGD
ncbi:MAG: branched-chain amino acid transport system ATP-binding protein livM [Micromonosporaceae bacterium]|jgi:ABC-type branched-subunit amino acid transport system ATPase component